MPKKQKAEKNLKKKIGSLNIIFLINTTASKQHEISHYTTIFINL